MFEASIILEKDFKNLEKIDLGESFETYQKNKGDYVPCRCFNNAFAILTNNLRENARAVFGYVLSTNGERKVAVRHAWNKFDLCRDTIDVTMIANDENPLSMLSYRYLPIDIYTSNEFLDKIEENGGFPCLPKSNKELKIIKELEKKGYEVLE